MFEPKRVIFENAALKYKTGKEIMKYFKYKDVELLFSKSGRITQIPGSTASRMYFEGKSTLVVGIRKPSEFQSCKPSAHYQLPLVSGCMGMCEYCYLNTRMGKKPYTKVYVNIDEILNRADKYVKERQSDITVFEGAATSDPIPVEPYTKNLEKCILHFGKSQNSYFKFVTKFTDIDNLLNLKHNGKTTIRFSINTDKIINNFEHGTPKFKDRMNAAKKVLNTGYNMGFIIAPVFLYPNWETEYKGIINEIGKNFSGSSISFEIISHRFTKKAKENILTVYPKTMLPMEEEMRKFKYGQFGYGKYVYRDDELKYMKEFFKENIEKYFDNSSIKYII
ncbi:spore photoproduct lyase [Clostridium tyrobutyricum]|uniref:spore photoproduct lyase n=1 Tax=Clostridium tyrobutyricum TaxID=1519 RepID=UPI001C3942CB|nr:spore photoproduct lyase [Clostridium tyrobutyricum]MBV4420047.1 spore photoproduct lyase [Clostridium tyrobutyricum]